MNIVKKGIAVMYRKITLFFCSILLHSMCENVRAQRQQNAITERMTNFTLELLFHTMTATGENSNLILSPVSIWGLLLVMSSGSTGVSRRQINMAIRMSTTANSLNKEALSYFQQFATGMASTFEIQKLNAIFEDRDILPLADFSSSSLNYGVDVLPLDFSNSDELNQNLSSFKSQYPQLTLYKPNDIKPKSLLPLTAFNLRGDWTYRFDNAFTTKQSFYDTQGKKIGHVNMMYNRHTYSVTNIDGFNARALEIPYASGGFSMILLLPNSKVSLKEVLYGFTNSTFDLLVNELDKVQNLREEILAVIPRFNIKSNLDMKPALNMLGIYDVFDEKRASFALAARTPTYVDKFIHNVAIDVTESGTRQSEAMERIIGTRVGVASFVANKPFLYFIVEKTTNSIMFCGQYQVPVLY